MHIGIKRNQIVIAKSEVDAAKSKLEEAYKSFAKEFRKRRQDAGWSIRDVAQKLSLSPAFISDVELGRRNANEDMLFFFDDYDPRI